MLLVHYRKWWKAYTLPLATVIVASFFVRLDVNVTPSLPDHLFLTVKGMPPNVERGDYIVFRWHGGGPVPEGTQLTKIVGGVPGDTVVMDEQRRFFIHKGDGTIVVQDQFVGKAKTLSRTGEPLQAGPTGVIPPDHYYVLATHPDSLDSRYSLTGWIKKDAIVGRTFPVF
jgi:conjugal transfer pilin signal peptidase TrbI